jgi:hypothetical protein
VEFSEALVTAEQVPALLLAALPSLSEKWAEVDRTSLSWA